MSGAERMIEEMNKVAFKNRCFEFLDDVRESGAINMFGATPYLQEAFDLDKREAREILVEWMQTFAERHPE